MAKTFTAATFQADCDLLTSNDPDLANIVKRHGYPPLWSRPNTFETVVQIILEQQVSLASAKAALEKLRERITFITPTNVLALSDEELRACYFSRQKTSYVQSLSEAILSNEIDLAKLELLPNDAIRNKLLVLKGIGHCTIDVYLILVLHRSDIFPIGDIAAVNSLKKLKHLAATTTREELLAITESWKPYRSIATMLLWHVYLETKGLKA